MRISGAFPSDYLKAADLQGRSVPVRMSHVDMEDIGGDVKPVLRFEGKEKGLVLNKTNSSNIALLYGDETENWRGREIVLFETWVDFRGKTVQAIRVRAPQPKDDQPRQSPPTQPAPQPAPQHAAQPHGSIKDQLDDEIPF